MTAATSKLETPPAPSGRGLFTAEARAFAYGGMPDEAAPTGEMIGIVVEGHATVAFQPAPPRGSATSCYRRLLGRIARLHWREG